MSDEDPRRQQLRAAARRLHLAAGEPTLDVLAGYADGRRERSALGNVTSGPKWPSWGTVKAYIDACVQHAAKSGLRLPAKLTDEKVWSAMHQAGSLAKGRPSADASPDTAQVADGFLPAATKTFAGGDAELELLLNKRSTQLDPFSKTTIDVSAVPRPDQTPPPARGWTVPLPSSEVFVGRDEIMAQLRAGFSAGAVGQCLHGLGGVGKTRLAVEYAYAYRDTYPGGVWWIPAAGGVSAGLAKLARWVSSAWATLPDDAASAWAESWLRHWSGWLLILDDASDPAAVTALLGRLAHAAGHLLITSRRDLSWTVPTVPIGVLDPGAATELLLSRTGQDNRTAAAAIAAELGCLPVALEHIAAYAKHTALALDRCLSRLREQPGRIFTAELPNMTAVARVWDLTLAELEAADPHAGPLLAVLAWLAPDDIPRDVLGIHVTGDESAGWLASFGMITLTDDAIDMHPVLQAVIRMMDTDDPKAADDRMLAHRFAIRMLGKLLPDDATDVTAWPRWRRLIPHLDALAGHLPSGTELDSPLGLLLNEAGMFELSQGRAEAATTRLTRALELTSAAFGDDHPSVAIRLNNLAAAHWRAGRPARAAELVQRALTNTEATAGSDHPDMIIRLNSLGVLLIDQDRTDEALAQLGRALAIAEALPDPPKILATVLINIGTCHRHAGRLADAEAAMRRALALTEDQYGPAHPALAAPLHSLASVCRHRRHFEEAQKHGLRGLAIAEKTLPPGHFHIAEHLNGLGVTTCDLGRPADAVPLFQQAAGILGDSVDTESSLLAEVLNNLITARVAAGAPSAELERTVESAPDDHIRVGLLNTLALACTQADRPADALAAALRAARIAEATGHKDLPLSLCRAAAAHLALGDAHEAVAIQQHALKLARSKHNPGYRTLAEHLTVLGDAYEALGRTPDALRCYQRGLRGQGDSPWLVPLLMKASTLQLKLGQKAEAVATFERADRIMEEHYGRDHPTS
ncbi:tetratricopeptide repeat protein [Actinoplanes sp. NPDC049802]|uniref:tetratricopeptide repeat protein n=1 Tax=Actinoplanes sp. NPDC049802 TaxID=3154742 RepID=UPI0033D72392